MWGFALCAWLTNIRSVFTFHNVFPTHFYTYPFHCLIRWTAKYIFQCRFQTISDSVYNHEVNFYKNNTYKIYNWYGSNRYFPAKLDDKIIFRKELDIDEDMFVMISVGGCSHIKRHTDIIKGLPMIIQKIPKCLYLHLGTGLTEKEEIYLAEEIGVLNHIRFCGNQIDVRKYLIASDVYIMPSQFEGIPITTIEAMACCIPTILYDVPGLRDFNLTGKNCILIPEDYGILVDKIINLYTNPEILSEMVLRAKEFVNENFNMSINVQKIFQLYI